MGGPCRSIECGPLAPLPCPRARMCRHCAALQGSHKTNVPDELAARAKAIELFNAKPRPGLPLAVVRDAHLPAQPKKRTSQQAAVRQQPAKQPRLPSASSGAAQTQVPVSQLRVQPAAPAGNHESSFNLPPRLLDRAAWVRGCACVLDCAASGSRPLLTHKHCSGMTRIALLMAPSATWSALARCVDVWTCAAAACAFGLDVPTYVFVCRTATVLPCQQASPRSPACTTGRSCRRQTWQSPCGASCSAPHARCRQRTRLLLCSLSRRMRSQVLRLPSRHVRIAGRMSCAAQMC